MSARRAPQPPVLDAAARQRLTAALDREGVVAGYLFGSQVKGSVGPLSDVDIAVWADPRLGASERGELALRLQAPVEQAVQTDAADLVVLNDAPPLLRHRALRDHLLLIDRDPRTRIRLEARALLDFLDTQPLRDELDRGLAHRIEERRFGRR